MHLATIVVGGLSFLIPWGFEGARVVAKLTRRADPAVAEPPTESRKRSSKKLESSGGSRGKKAGDARSKSDRPDPLAAPWLRVFKLILFVTFSFLSWRATRNSHQFAAVVGTVTAWNFAEWGARTGLASSKTARAACQLGVAVVVTVVFVLVGSGAFYRWAGEERTTLVAFGTEAGLFTGAGIPCIVCGPGHIAQAHQPDEFVELEQLARCDAFLQALGQARALPGLS